MIAFWIAAVALVIVGYVFFIPVFLGKPRSEPLSRAKLNLLLHQQRQQELAREAVGPEDLERLAAESERNLLGDLETLQPHDTQSAETGRTLVVCALVSLPIFAFSVYLALGRPDLVGPRPTAANEESGQARRDDVQTSIEKLAQRLKEKPDDLEGWVLLGRSLQSTGQSDKAVQAYEFALKQAPDNLDLKAMYAEALAEASQGSAAGRPMEIIQEILAKDPNHKGGLWMAGVAAAQQKETAKAVDYWEKLKAQFPADSEEARQIGNYIAQAQGKPMEPEAPATAQASPKQAPAAAQPGKRIRVKVTLSDAVKAQASPDDALFIFARAAEGPPMPLAVVRKKAGDLPLEVELDDAMAMMQGMNLSSVEHLVIGARISKTGKPTPTPGDLQGLTQPVSPKDGDSYAVVVDQVVGAP